MKISLIAAGAVLAQKPWLSAAALPNFGEEAEWTFDFSSGFESTSADGSKSQFSDTLGDLLSGFTNSGSGGQSTCTGDGASWSKLNDLFKSSGSLGTLGIMTDRLKMGMKSFGSAMQKGKDFVDTKVLTKTFVKTTVAAAFVCAAYDSWGEHTKVQTEMEFFRDIFEPELDKYFKAMTMGLKTSMDLVPKRSDAVDVKYKKCDTWADLIDAASITKSFAHVPIEEYLQRQSRDLYWIKWKEVGVGVATTAAGGLMASTGVLAPIGISVVGGGATFMYDGARAGLSEIVEYMTSEMNKLESTLKVSTDAYDQHCAHLE